MFVSVKKVNGGWLVQEGEQLSIYVDELKLVQHLRTIEENVRRWVSEAPNKTRAFIELVSD